MNDYGYMGRESRYVEYYSNYQAETITEIGGQYLKELFEAYEKVTMEDWFEDKTIVEKQIPEFNFV